MERTAKQTHEALLLAREYHQTGEVGLALLVAKQHWPIAVIATHRRYFATGHNGKCKTTKGALVAMRSKACIDDDVFQVCVDADSAATSSWTDARDANAIIDAALTLLERSESRTVKRRRHASQPNQPRRWSLASLRIGASS